jgi:hypothetical protein
MILSKTQKIMKTGIAKYSKSLERKEEDIQIQVKADQNSEGVIYQICDKWNPKIEVSFKDIMDTKIDLLGFESMSAPFMRKSVDLYIKYYESISSDISLFIFKKDNRIGVAVYDKSNFKEMITLEKQFQRIGL